MDVIDALVSQGRIPGDLTTRRQLVRFLDAIEEDMANIIFEEGLAVAQRGRNSVISRLQRQGVSVAFSDLSVDIANRLRAQVFVASSRTLSRMTGNVMDLLADSFEEGIGIFEVAERLQGVFENMRYFETERIARTEIVGAQNLSAYETERELGIDYHMWFTAEDDRVRSGEADDEADHVVMHGEIVRVGEPFSNGLYYPGDRNGPISEWINCRCTTVPFLIPEGFMAPAGVLHFREGDLVPLAS